jgi:hypothetical protein
MEGFSDLIWLLIMFLVITRGLGAARKSKQPPKPPAPSEIPERSSRPAPASRPSEPAVRRAEQSVDHAQSGPGRSSRAAKRSDPVTEFRRRLMEAAREWEAEQRRRAGVPIEELPETASPRPEATIDPSRRDRSGVPRDPSRGAAEPALRQPAPWETRDVTPDRMTEQLATRVEVPTPRATRPQPERAEGPAPLAPAGSPQVEVPLTDPSRSGRPAHEPLARLDRFQPLKRAVVLAEILGLPRAVSDDPSSKRGGR